MILLRRRTCQFNESAFECGFLLKEIQTSNERVLFANPSPFLIEKDNCSDFLVCDKYFANAYKSEFPNKNFITYENLDITVQAYNK